MARVATPLDRLIESFWPKKQLTNLRAMELYSSICVMVNWCVSYRHSFGIVFDYLVLFSHFLKIYSSLNLFKQRKFIFIFLSLFFSIYSIELLILSDTLKII